jgi:uncharacterized SAM-binding protein YcdF (DUF218 family)
MRPMSNIAPPDAIIIIFGAALRRDGRPSETLRRRVDAAARFGAHFDAPLFIPTGAVGRYGGSEASAMAGLLKNRGTPRERIELEETGSDTLSSVRAVRRLLRDRPSGPPIYAVTSGFHLPRCLLLLRLAGIPARAAPLPFPPAPEHRLRGDRTLQRLLRGYWAPRRLLRGYRWLREAAALPYDTALMLWLRLIGQL